MPGNEKLIREIREAFASVPKPTVTLRVARGADDHDYDWKKLQKLDAHYRTWEEIPVADLKYFQDVFPWMTEESYLFYLPAYMMRMLTGESLLKTQYGSEPGYWSDSAFGEDCVAKGMFNLFDRSQLQVTLQFLELLFSEIKDDYHADWWNHPWDSDWSYDQPKDDLWRSCGVAYKYLTAKLAEK